MSVLQPSSAPSTRTLLLSSNLIFIILLTITQLAQCKPYVANRRLSLGEQVTWRFGGWRPILPGNPNFHPEDQHQGSSSQLKPSSSRAAPRGKQLEPEQVKIDEIASATSKENSVASFRSNFGRISQDIANANSSPQAASSDHIRPAVVKGPEVTLAMPPHGPHLTIGRVKGPYKVDARPVKEAEMHAYEVIKRLKERGRDIEKDYGTLSIPDSLHGLTVSYGKNLASSASSIKNRAEGSKRYVTVPVAIETDHDKVLTQNDIKDIEKEVLRIIPEVEHGLVEGAVKEGAKVLEFGSEMDRKPLAMHLNHGQTSMPVVISGTAPVVYESTSNMVSKPIKSRISSILRPLLAKFRPPSRSPPSYSQSDPRNLNIIHLIAHQEQLPTIVPVDRLVRRPEIGKPGMGQGKNRPETGYQQPQQQIQYQIVSHKAYKMPNQNSYPQSQLQKVQYKIIHPPPSQAQHENQYQSQFHHHSKMNQYQTGQSKGSNMEYQTQLPDGPIGPIGPPSMGKLDGSQINSHREANGASPAYQVIELPRGYQVSTEHLLEAPPQVVSLTGGQLNHQSNQYMTQEEHNMPGVSYANEKGPLSNLTPSPQQSFQPNYSVDTDSRPYSEPPTNAYYTTPGKSLTYDSGSAMDQGYNQQNNQQHQPSGQYQGASKVEDGYAGHQVEQVEEQYGTPMEGSYAVAEEAKSFHQHETPQEFNGHTGPSHGAFQESTYQTQPSVSNSDESYSSGEQAGALMPSVQYAEAPKIELLNGQSPNFHDNGDNNQAPGDENRGDNLQTGEIDTKTLINLITNQIPSLQNVLRESDYANNKAPNDNNVNNYVQQASLDRNNDGENQRSPIYSVSQVNLDSRGSSNGQDAGPKFGQRIRHDDNVYAQAEQFDDKMFQANDPALQGLYIESSNSEEVRVRSNQTYNSTLPEKEEKYAFVKITSTSEPSVEVSFGTRVNSTGASSDSNADKSKPVQLYHAYYGSKDHIPPPGYTKITLKELQENFKDAQVHVSESAQQSSAPLAQETAKPETSESESSSTAG